MQINNRSIAVILSSLCIVALLKYSPWSVVQNTERNTNASWDDQNLDLSNWKKDNVRYETRILHNL